MRESHSGSDSRWWRRIVAVAVVVMVLAVAGAWWLVDPLSVGEPKDRASAIGTVFTIGFGFGGLATLGLFTRRQWHQERVHEHERQVTADARREAERAYEHQRQVADEARYDAEQRRITEQYMKAVEQLGHEKAPVRLGGLYALDRLGRNHPEQRQMITEVWCAYLRRKYTPPDDFLDEAGSGRERDRAEEQVQIDVEAADEYEVRMTAQRLLIGHLKDPRPRGERDDTRPEESEEYWHLQRVDLTGATLVGNEFGNCRLPELKADRARFCHSVSFTEAHFETEARFLRARFEGGINLDRARFEGDALFSGARFGALTRLRSARFGGSARFSGAQFESDAWFEGTRFDRDAWFEGAQFDGDAWFDEVQFHRDAWFEGARFDGDTGFNQTRFESGAWFNWAWFGDRAQFNGARFKVSVKVEDPPATAYLVTMADAAVDRIDFEGRAHVWPPGWETAPDGDTWRLVPIED